MLSSSGTQKQTERTPLGSWWATCFWAQFQSWSSDNDRQPSSKAATPTWEHCGSCELENCAGNGTKNATLRNWTYGRRATTFVTMHHCEMEDMGGKTHSRALMAQVWSQNRTRTTLIDIMRKCEFAQRLASRCTTKPDHIRDDSGLRREAMRRKLGTAGLGFLATRAQEASASCADDIFLISATKKDLESMIALELQNVGL